MNDLQLAKQCPRHLRTALGVLIAQPAVRRVIDGWETDAQVLIGSFTGDHRVLALIADDHPNENMTAEEWKGFVTDTIEHWLEAFELDANEDPDDAFRSANRNAYNALVAGAVHFGWTVADHPQLTQETTQ